MSAAEIVTLELDAETVELLDVLTGGITACETVPDVLQHLARSAADGVSRPGAWERGWIVQAFGDEWEAKLEADPSAPRWRRRPRRRP